MGFCRFLCRLRIGHSSARVRVLPLKLWGRFPCLAIATTDLVRRAAHRLLYGHREGDEWGCADVSRHGRCGAVAGRPSWIRLFATAISMAVVVQMEGTNPWYETAREQGGRVVLLHNSLRGRVSGWLLRIGA